MAESTGQTRISRYIGLYSAESTITHAKSSLRLFLGSALGRKLTAETLEAAGEQYFAERRDYFSVEATNSCQSQTDAPVE